MYIDDLIIIWDRSSEEFKDFTDYLNLNDGGWKFSGETNPRHINYLDITLTNSDNKIITKNYFKPVDSNSLLDFHSCHYRKWFSNIPFGQFKRLRRNCTTNKDYIVQSKILRKKLKDKKYPRAILEGAYKNLRLCCIRPRQITCKKEDSENTFQYSFMTTYKQEHKKVRDILFKHWHMF